MLFAFDCSIDHYTSNSKTVVTAATCMLERGCNICEVIAELLGIPVEDVQEVKEEAGYVDGERYVIQIRPITLIKKCIIFQRRGG